MTHARAIWYFATVYGQLVGLEAKSFSFVQNEANQFYRLAIRSLFLNYGSAAQSLQCLSLDSTNLWPFLYFKVAFIDVQAIH